MSCAPTRSVSRRRPSATTASSAKSSICSRSPTTSARACRCGTRAAASSAWRWSSTPASATSRPATTTPNVHTPPIAKQDLFLRSNHLVTYKEGMFPPLHVDQEIDESGEVVKQGSDYYLKPMNCPMHILIYA